MLCNRQFLLEALPCKGSICILLEQIFCTNDLGALYYMHAVDMLLEKNYELLPENFGRIRAMTLLTACQSDRMPIVEQNKSIDNLNRGWLSALMGYLG